MRSDEKVVGLDGCSDQCVHPEKVQLVLDATLPVDDLARAASMFKLLGDLTRSRLLFALLEAGELCVCDLAAATRTQEATVSQSLRMLRASGVVTGRRQGRLVFYRLADAHVRMLLDLTREHIAHDATGVAGGVATSAGVIR
ncbi:ArsR/SmtB family transcription factor [Knoellia subterranea]|uniref:ArsR family transcriptional regulator n=1 Tax=Knoellia subterranea KCTC 19937 TaxID=1385521 RepID=A0A0A0JKJ0_9MICO|nr:metalloregulator ArsR/SmtB family transcription factor [Knoellia subterranea]KGN36557.1 ArsR family transcriptional regulator [Knoellia subterranea KCTC 19937]